MGYKILGYVVWQVMKLYVRRRARDVKPALIAAGVGAVALAGVGVAAAIKRGEK